MHLHNSATAPNPTRPTRVVSTHVMGWVFVGNFSTLQGSVWLENSPTQSSPSHAHP